MADDDESMLRRFCQLVVDSGFADRCEVEACMPESACSGEALDAPSSAEPASRARTGVLEAPTGTSVMHVPLLARGAVLGLMALTRFCAGYSEADRALAEALAWCAALAIDNAARTAAARICADASTPPTSTSFARNGTSCTCDSPQWSAGRAVS